MKREHFNDVDLLMALENLEDDYVLEPHGRRVVASRCVELEQPTALVVAGEQRRAA